MTDFNQLQMFETGRKVLGQVMRMFDKPPGSPKSSKNCLFLGSIEETDHLGVALHKEATYGSRRALKKVLNTAICVDYPNSLGQTPLFCACARDNESTAVLLLQWRANPNEKCFNGMTPCHAAAYIGNIYLLGKLIEAGGDLRLHDNNGNSMRDWALKNPELRKRSKMLEFIDKTQMQAMACNGEAVSQANVMEPAGRPHLQTSVMDIMRKTTGSNHSFESLKRVQSTGFGRVYLGNNYNGGIISAVPLISEASLLATDEKKYDTGFHTCIERMQWLNEAVSVKQLTSDVGFEDGIDLLINDAEFLGKLRHPNILLLMGICQSTYLDRIMLVFECIENLTLHHFLHKTTNPLLYNDCLSIMQQVCAAMDFIHCQHLIHCGLSSFAVYLVSSQTTKVGNFEFMVESIKTDLGKPSCVSLMSHGEFLYNWMSPELMDCLAPHYSSDVYSFCCIVWELFTREVPWHNLPPESIKKKIVEERKGININTPKIPSQIKAIIGYGLELKEERRLNKFSFIIDWMKSEKVPKFQRTVTPYYLWNKSSNFADQVLSSSSTSSTSSVRNKANVWVQDRLDFIRVNERTDNTNISDSLSVSCEEMDQDYSTLPLRNNYESSSKNQLSIQKSCKDVLVSASVHSDICRMSKKDRKCVSDSDLDQHQTSTFPNSKPIKPASHSHCCKLGDLPGSDPHQFQFHASAATLPRKYSSHSSHGNSFGKSESRESVKKLADLYQVRLMQHKLRQAILKGSMAPRGSCQDLDSSSESIRRSCDSQNGDEKCHVCEDAKHVSMEKSLEDVDMKSALAVHACEASHIKSSTPKESVAPDFHKLPCRHGGDGYDGCSDAHKILLEEVKAVHQKLMSRSLGAVNKLSCNVDYHSPDVDTCSPTKHCSHLSKFMDNSSTQNEAQVFPASSKLQSGKPSHRKVRIENVCQVCDEMGIKNNFVCDVNPDIDTHDNSDHLLGTQIVDQSCDVDYGPPILKVQESQLPFKDRYSLVDNVDGLRTCSFGNIHGEGQLSREKQQHRISETAETTELGYPFLKENQQLLVDTSHGDDVDTAYHMEAAGSHIYKVVPAVSTTSNKQMIVDTSHGDDVDTPYVQTAETQIYKIATKTSITRDKQMIVDSAGGDDLDTAFILETAGTRIYQVAPMASTHDDSACCTQNTSVDSERVGHWIGSKLTRIKEKVRLRPSKLVQRRESGDSLHGLTDISLASTMEEDRSKGENISKGENYCDLQTAPSKIDEFKVDKSYDFEFREFYIDDDLDGTQYNQQDNSCFQVPTPSCNTSTKHSADDSTISTGAAGNVKKKAEFFVRMMSNVKPPMFPRKPKKPTDLLMKNIFESDLSVDNIVVEKHEAATSRDFWGNDTFESQECPCVSEWRNTMSKVVTTSGADIDIQTQTRLVTSGSGQTQARLVTSVDGQTQARLVTSVDGQTQARLVTSVDGQTQARLTPLGDGSQTGGLPSKQLTKMSQRNKGSLNKEDCLCPLRKPTIVNKALEEERAIHKEDLKVVINKDNFEAPVCKEDCKHTINQEAVPEYSNPLDQVDNTCGGTNKGQLSDKGKKVNGTSLITEACQTSLTEIYHKNGPTAGSDSDSDCWVKTRLLTIQKKIQRRRSRLAYSVSSDESSDNEEFSLSQQLSTEIKHRVNHGKTSIQGSDGSAVCPNEGNLHLVNSKRLKNQSQNSGAATKKPGKTEEKKNELQHLATQGDIGNERQRKESLSLVESFFKKKKLRNKKHCLSPKQGTSNARQHQEDFTPTNCGENNPKVTSSKILCQNMPASQNQISSNIVNSHKKKNSSKSSGIISADCTDSSKINSDCKGSVKSVHLSEVSAKERRSLEKTQTSKTSVDDSTSKKSNHSILRRPRNLCTNVADLNKTGRNNLIPSPTPISRSKFSLGHDSKVSDKVISFQDISDSEPEMPDSEKALMPLKKSRLARDRSQQRKENLDSSKCAEIVQIWLERENFAERVSLDSSRQVDQQSITSKVMEIQSMSSKQARVKQEISAPAPCLQTGNVQLKSNSALLNSKQSTSHMKETGNRKHLATNDAKESMSHSSWLDCTSIMSDSAPTTQHAGELNCIDAKLSRSRSKSGHESKNNSLTQEQRKLNTVSGDITSDQYMTLDLSYFSHEKSSGGQYHQRRRAISSAKSRFHFSTSKKSNHSILRRPRNLCTNVADLNKTGRNNLIPSPTPISRSKFSLGHDSKVSDKVISFQDISDSEPEMPDSEKALMPLKKSRLARDRSQQRKENLDSSKCAEIVQIWLERENFAERVSLDSSRQVDQQSITSKVMEIQSMSSKQARVKQEISAPAPCLQTGNAQLKSNSALLNSKQSTSHMKETGNQKHLATNDAKESMSHSSWLDCTSIMSDSAPTTQHAGELNCIDAKLSRSRSKSGHDSKNNSLTQEQRKLNTVSGDITSDQYMTLDLSYFSHEKSSECTGSEKPSPGGAHRFYIPRERCPNGCTAKLNVSIGATDPAVHRITSTATDPVSGLTETLLDETICTHNLRSSMHLE